MLRNDCPRLHLYAKADASVQLARVGILGTLAGNSGIYLIYIIALYAYSSTIANRDTVLTVLFDHSIIFPSSFKDQQGLDISGRSIARL